MYTLLHIATCTATQPKLNEQRTVKTSNSKTCNDKPLPKLKPNQKEAL